MSLINNPSMNKAEAFLNLTFIDSNGVEYKLSKGLALHEDKALDKALIDAAKADDEFTLTLTGKVFVVTEPTAADLPVFASEPAVTTDVPEVVAPAVAEAS